MLQYSTSNSFTELFTLDSITQRIYNVKKHSRKSMVVDIDRSDTWDTYQGVKSLKCSWKYRWEEKPQNKVSLCGFHASGPHRHWHFAAPGRGERQALYLSRRLTSASASTFFFVLTFKAQLIALTSRSPPPQFLFMLCWVFLSKLNFWLESLE